MALFKKILIANRGEIAIRVIRAARKLGIQTVAVFSEADRQSLHVQLADEAYCIGPASASESYLAIPAVMSAVEISKAEAVHPGYGFLSENPSFAEICENSGVKFIGPSARAIELMGNKSEARKQMEKAGLPVTPGSPGTFQSCQEAFDFARSRLGFPVLLKAAAGGGGRGMRLVLNSTEFISSFNMAQREAQNAFDNGALYVEKYIQNPKHIEVQIIGDSHGNLVHLGERDCSIQRRHQKLIEETPCHLLDDATRGRILEAALKAARTIGYENAGTLEFLLDADKNFYFMEMNTRLQVEHPVSEYTHLVDLVAEQIKVAAGERLSFTQSSLKGRGHSLECRVNAEDPDFNFAPCPGTITNFRPAMGPFVRVDTAVYNGYTVPPNYDSLIAKLVVWGHDRNDAVSRMAVALREFHVEGIKTTIPLFQKIMREENFRRGTFGTKYLEQFFS